MRRTYTFLLVMSMFLMAPSVALGVVVDVTPATLTSLVEDLDGATVRFTAEVVSEALRADDAHVWLNMSGDGVAIGVYMPTEMAEQVTTFGDYGHDGDVVEVLGVYNEACDQHGGDMDVHAESLVVLTAGSEREHGRPQLWKGAIGVIGLLVALVQSRRFRRMRDEVVS